MRTDIEIFENVRFIVGRGIGATHQWVKALRAFSEDKQGELIAPCDKPSITSLEVMKYCEHKALVLSGHWNYDADAPTWTDEEEARLLDAAESYFARLHRLESCIPIHDEWPEDRLDDWLKKLET